MLVTLMWLCPAVAVNVSMLACALEACMVHVNALARHQVLSMTLLLQMRPWWCCVSLVHFYLAPEYYVIRCTITSQFLKYCKIFLSRRYQIFVFFNFILDHKMCICSYPGLNSLSMFTCVVKANSWWIFQALVAHTNLETIFSCLINHMVAPTNWFDFPGTRWVLLDFYTEL
jgi:hypothetical protein